jgi:hypothetical protein
MSSCDAVSDLAPLSAMVNLQSLGMYGCSAVSDLAPLGSLVALKTLRLFHSDFSLVDLPTLQLQIDRGEMKR